MIEPFHRGKILLLQQTEAEIHRNFRLSENESFNPLDELQQWRQGELYTAYLELQNGLEKLQWYNRVNHDAIDKMIAKLEKRHVVNFNPNNDYKTKWIESKRAREMDCLGKVADLEISIAKLSRASSDDSNKHDGSGLLDKLHTVNALDDQKDLVSFIISAGRYANIKLPHLLNETTNRVSIEAINRAFQLQFDILKADQIQYLQVRDAFGRVALHYSAMYGLVQVSNMLLQLSKTNSSRASPVNDVIFSKDSEGHTPLHLAVIHGHADLTRLFLTTLKEEDQCSIPSSRQAFGGILYALLRIAIQYQHDSIFYLLTSCHMGFSGSSPRGHTALYLAAQIGRGDYVEEILKILPAERDISEPVYGWTPLFVACVEGSDAVVSLLLQAGADQNRRDNSGWTAKEHAALRGYLQIAADMDCCDQEHSINTPITASHESGVSKDKCATDCNYVLVSLGNMQKGKAETAVDLDICSSKVSRGVPKYPLFSIEISVSGNNEFRPSVKLPILDDKLNEPFTFRVDDIEKAYVTFNILREDIVDKDQRGIIVGSGTSALDGYGHYYGENRESLLRDRTVLILSKENLRSMGIVTFTYLIARSFPHEDFETQIPQKFVEPERSVELVGHRGKFSAISILARC